jgi:hypothetical protein
MALAAVFVAALVTTLAGLAWAVASNVWGRVSVRRWDRGLL